MQLDKCMQELAQVVEEFLVREGATSNYLTFLRGTVTADGPLDEELSWSTPKSKDELTVQGFKRRTDELRASIVQVLVANNVPRIRFDAVDEGYGMMSQRVVYWEEVIKHVRINEPVDTPIPTPLPEI